MDFSCRFKVRFECFQDGPSRERSFPMQPPHPLTDSSWFLETLLLRINVSSASRIRKGNIAPVIWMGKMSDAVVGVISEFTPYYTKSGLLFRFARIFDGSKCQDREVHWCRKRECPSTLSFLEEERRGGGDVEGEEGAWRSHSPSFSEISALHSSRKFFFFPASFSKILVWIPED